MEKLAAYLPLVCLMAAVALLGFGATSPDLTIYSG